MCVYSINYSISDRQEDSYQYDNGYRTGKAPDEFVIDGDPTEVWVPITLWVQAHCQACREETASQIKQEELLTFLLLSITERGTERASTVSDRMTVAGKVRDIIEHISN